jgi:transcriptional regulator with XRE-family HTH domain
VTEIPLSVTIPEWTITDRLKKAREHAGFTQVEMARELGIGRSTLAAYESGKNAIPRKIVLAWAICTGVPREWLLGRQHAELTPIGVGLSGSTIRPSLICRNKGALAA